MALERPDQVAADLFARLPLTPDVLVAKFELVREAALLIQFDQSAYRAASFLDERLQTPETRGAWVPLAGVVRKAAEVRNARPLGFIFHTGHVGSTLVSRLLDEAGTVLSLREPLPLRQLAAAHDAVGSVSSLLNQAQFDDLLESFLRFWSRGYETTRLTVVKATSTAGRLVPAMFAKRGDARGIYMNLRAEPYLATLLGGQNSPADLRGHAAERIAAIAGAGRRRSYAAASIVVGRTRGHELACRNLEPAQRARQRMAIASSRWISTHFLPTCPRRWGASPIISDCRQALNSCPPSDAVRR